MGASTSSRGSWGYTGVPFRHRPNIAGKPEILQPLKKLGAKPIQLLQLLNLLWCEPQVLYHFGNALLATGKHEIPVFGQFPEKQAEGGRLGHILSPVGLDHGQLIEIDHQGQIFFADHQDTSYGKTQVMVAPADLSSSNTASAPDESTARVPS